MYSGEELHEQAGGLGYIKYTLWQAGSLFQVLVWLVGPIVP